MMILMLDEHVDSILMLCQFVLMSHIHIYSEYAFPQAGVAVHRSLGEVSDHKGRAHLGEAKQRRAQVRLCDGGDR